MVRQAVGGLLAIADFNRRRVLAVLFKQRRPRRKGPKVRPKTWAPPDPRALDLVTAQTLALLASAVHAAGLRAFTT